MTRKKKKVGPVKKYQSLSFNVKETVLQDLGKSMPTNLEEEKEKFFKSGKNPKFNLQDPSKICELASKAKNQIRFQLLGEAEYILEKVRDEYGSGEQYMEQAYGVRITREQATPMVLEYINENSLSESINIHWCDNMACSAKMMWTGPMMNANKPELRKYSLWINSSEENTYMRESGIKCLMDHEIGTHFFRTFNDGFQPWYSERSRFGLRNLGSLEGQCTEEGLATVHTVLRGKLKLLWTSALAYYTACKSAEMTFKQLFDHIGRYTVNPDLRWKQVMRVKRGLADPNDLGGFGNDQCYFEGAVKILRNMDNIDFYLLMMGKVCYDEVDRIKRVARKDVVRFPIFMKSMNAYRRSLKKMSEINGLNVIQPLYGPPSAYLKRLDERKEGGKKGKKVRAHPKNRRFSHSVNSNRKEKNVPVDDQSEIKSFALSNPLINFQKRKAKKEVLQENDNGICNLIDSVSNQLESMNQTIDAQIKHLQDIVREHSWVSEDNDYREGLLEEASFSASADDFLVLSEICCLANDRPSGGDKETNISSDPDLEETRSQQGQEGGTDAMVVFENRSQSCLANPVRESLSSHARSSSALTLPDRMTDRPKINAVKRAKTLDKWKKKTKAVFKPPVAKFTSRENLDLSPRAMKQNIQTLKKGAMNGHQLSPRSVRTVTPLMPEVIAIAPPILSMSKEGTAVRKQLSGSFSPQMPSTEESTSQNVKTTGAPAAEESNHHTGLLIRKRLSQSSTLRPIMRNNCSMLPDSGDITITPLNISSLSLKASPVTPPTSSQGERNKGSAEFQYRLSLRDGVHSSSLPERSYAMSSTLYQPLVLKSESALQKKETPSLDALPVVGSVPSK